MLLLGFRVSIHDLSKAVLGRHKQHDKSIIILAMKTPLLVNL
ncbi:unnamed protein product [Brassica rapa]|uniref:Uncharacterized protein n=2 Tax=Brassica TaxID=3705 RepID=A0A8D9GRP8_BRACM|nr:unnamed protein product [Brassica napus]CAG7885809.1 unnamed protein product [Brassica rapa]CDY32041.1 BnaA03g60450D [Brassica napus]